MSLTTNRFFCCITSLTIKFSFTNEADGSLSNITYNLSGFPDSTTDEDSVSRNFDYDTIYGKLANINDAQENYIAYDYDTQGNRIEMSKHASSDASTSRKRWDFQYPAIPGLLYREIKADDSYQQYGYDDEGNVTSVADYESHTTTYNYDPLNRPVSVTQPGDITTGYGYDTQSNLTSVTDAKNQVTSFIYDDMGRLVSSTSPDTSIKTYVYDEAGNTISKTDANGITAGYTYDDLNRLINVNFPDSAQNITYSYDTGTNGIGRRTGMVDPSGTVYFSYDSRGRLTGKTSIINGFTYNITSTFTPGNRVSSFTYPSGRSIDYTRNALGRWDTVTTTYNSSIITLAGNLSYRPFSIPNGMNTGSGGAVSNVSGECDCLTISNPGQPMEQTFTYDHNSNLKTIRGTNTPWYNQDFTYDALNRLTDATGAYGSINYTYDNVGNRMTRTIGSQTETCTYITGTNKLYQITGTGDPVTYTYDANGNVTGIGNKALTYNQNNRLIRVEENSDILGEYKYNGLGQRVIKEADGVITVFHYDNYGKLIAESLADGTITAEYLYMGKIRMAKVDVATGVIYYYLNNRLGTPQILTDDTGKVVWEAEYKPFGEANVNPNSEVVNNIRLPGQYFDSETGLHYNLHRHYNPATGRFLTADPIGLAGGINPFLYSWANPINLIDPNGLEVLMLPGGGGVQSMTPMDLGFRDRSPDYYAFTFNLAVRNPITGAFIGWSGQAEIDRYGNLYTSPLGSSYGRTVTKWFSASLVAGWLDEESCDIPSEDRLMNFLEGGSVNLSAGYLVGVGYTFVPDKWNKGQRAIEIGIMTPQYGFSENYSYLAR